MSYNRINNLVGWAVFLIATIIYFLTIESTVSLWDCGEYITAAYKLEVGHPPGAPLFMLIGRVFSFFAAPDQVAVWINRTSALSSSFTILFTYWSIVLVAKKVLQRKNRVLSKADYIAVIGSGIVGSLAYAFSDTFWFSAVEGEVYAMSSLFTAAIFWVILKWDAEVIAQRNNEMLDTNPLRWIILLCFLFGLAIGVHLLGLLVIPAIVMVIYFNQWEGKISLAGTFLALIIGVASLGLIQSVLIPGIISVAASFEVAFVNNISLPFSSGTIFFLLLLLSLIGFGIFYSKKSGKPILNTIFWSFATLLIGYGSFAVIVIRSNANTPLDENDPSSLVTLHSYLQREQYGSWPFLSGPYWNSAQAPQEEWGDLSAFYLRRFVVTRNDEDIKAFIKEQDAKEYAAKISADVVEKYFSSNEKIRYHAVEKFEQTTIFPRMFYQSQDPNDPKIQAYKSWSGYDPNEGAEDAELGADDLRLPTYSENMTFLFSYQLNWMYWRYFMWNFAGRQNDIQGAGDNMRGNWISGFNVIDDARLGSQAEAPYFTTSNPTNNAFYLLPLVFGIIGMIYLFHRSKEDGFVLMTLFFFTGLAIILFLNIKPLEPRERDYAFAASFWAFSFFIGLAVLAMYDAYKSFTKVNWKRMAIGVGVISFFVLWASFQTQLSTFITWLIILIIGGAFLAIAFFMRNFVKNTNVGATIILILGMIIPAIMLKEGYDDHNRSDKSSAHELAHNYLVGCKKNGIIFTVGDNDTFPLWYLQEVEGKFTDVRVCNTSLFDTDWYTEQMKMKAYESEALPISFREDQTLMFEGGTDQIIFGSSALFNNVGTDAKTITKINKIKIDQNRPAFLQAFGKLKAATLSTVAKAEIKDAASFSKIKTEIDFAFAGSGDSINEKSMDAANKAITNLFTSYQSGAFTMDQKELEGLNSTFQSWESSWSFLPLKTAMEFTQNDDNKVNVNGNVMRAFPTTGFTIPVNKEAAINSGVVNKGEEAKVESQIQIKFDKSAITKSDVMILDILANNDWKRPIYFSSPGGTEVGMALYEAGYLRQIGLSWEVTPVKSEQGAPFNTERMYDNLMNVYDYGKMNQEGVLTDYYARRQTSQMRQVFAQLSQYYIQKVNSESEMKNQITPQMEASYRATGRGAEIDSIKKMFIGMEARHADYKQKVIRLIKKSLEVMPIDLVQDYGDDPMPQRGFNNKGDEQQHQIVSDGSLHDYVTLLYQAGAKADAEALGLKVADQIETIFNYFYASDKSFAQKNSNDLLAALNNYLVLQKISNDPKFGGANGKLANKTNAFINEFYSKRLGDMENEFTIIGADSAIMDFGLDVISECEALGIYYGAIANDKAANIPKQNMQQPILDSSQMAAMAMDETAAVRMQ